MDKKQLSEIIREAYYNNDGPPEIKQINDLIFDIIIPNVLSSIMIKEKAKTTDKDMAEAIDGINRGLNNYIKDRAKSLYGINLQPFTFISSPYKKGK